MQAKRFRHFKRWSLSSKLAMVLFLTVALPSMLFMVPYSFTRRQANIESNHKLWLEGQGTHVLDEIDQSLQALTFNLERQLYNPLDYYQLTTYLNTAGTASADAAEQNAFIERKIKTMMGDAVSISRVRFLDTSAALLIDATRQTDNIVFEHTLIDENTTPADKLIAENHIGTWSTVTSIYPNTDNILSIDVVFGLRVSWDERSVGPLLGFAIITQDLTQAANDELLPDLYSALQTIQGNTTDTALYLFNEDGTLVTTTPDLPLFTDTHASESFQLAQRGDTGITLYTSAISGKQVLGYHTMLASSNAPGFVLLIETPTATLTAQAITENRSSLLGISGGFLTLTLLALYFTRRIVIMPIQRITTIAREVAGGEFSRTLSNARAGDEIGDLSESFNNMSTQLLETIDALEQRVAERTQNLETTLEIGRVLTSIHDLDTLLREVVTLLRDRFTHIYHAQVFLVDPFTRRANLRASTGKIGQTLLERGHYLEVGSQSVIGSVTATGNAVVALDTSNNPIHKRNEFLPDTRAEMALPLRSGTRVIGALDVQSMDPNAFSEQDVKLFQGMADQITIAIENAALFAESSQRLQEIERLNRMLSNAAWDETAQSYASGILSADTDGQQPQPPTWSTLQERAIRTRQIAERIEGETVIFAVPVRLREQVLGAIEWQIPLARYTNNTRQTAEELSARLALTIDNIRLFEQSQQVARREQIVNQISSKLIGQTDIDQILQTAVRELGLALRTPHTAIRLASSHPHTVDD